MADVQFNKRFSPAEATRGQFVPIDTSTLTGYPTGDSQGLARGRYAQLNYIVGSEAGALNIALSGGTVILPVSTVNITTPVDTIEQLPDRTEYVSVAVPATAVGTFTFAQEVNLVEVYNNDSALNIYVGFNNVALGTLSAQAMPLQPDSFYSVERDTTNVYIGNVDPANSVDVRVVGHYRA